MKTFRLFLFLALAPLAVVAVAARAVADPEEAAQEGSVMFDGGSRYAAAASPQATAQDRAQLLAEFKKHIEMDDHGVPAERAAMDSMLAKMMESSTAREIAARFIKENARVKFSLGEIPGSTVVTVDGQKTVWGTRGYTQVDKNPPCVVMNKLYMQEGVEPGAGTLAHEMLGHALEKQLAGGLKDVYVYNTDEEENARLIGWLVGAELNFKPDDETWAYMQNPDENREYIKLMSPYYSLTLTSEEMKDPVPLYKKRFATAEKELKKIPETEKNRRNWAKIVDHFVNIHKMDAASFQTIRENISNGLKYLPVARGNLEQIKEALQERITFFESEEGRAFLAKLAKEADGEYFRQKDAVILERRERLAAQLAGKTQESFRTPPAVGQVTWDQLVELWKGEKKSCASGVLK
ncbi:MAG: hypothetical protein NTY45_03770 [Elusimicrobia bacterium]|nr:hypothetical protein [Elusimicrobiota bacterium]